MDALFVVKKMLGVLIVPPASLFVLMLLGLVFVRRWPRAAIAAIWVAFASLLMLSLPLTAGALTAALDPPRLDTRAFRNAKVIVVLGGGLRRETLEYGDTLSTYSLERVRYGAKLAKESGLPVLVTGGTVFGGPPEGDVMAKVLSTEFGVAPRWVENRSRDTKQNMLFTAELLKPEHIERVLLVTHDTHMRRALADCRAAGLDCWSAPVSSRGNASDSWIEQLPNAGSLRDSALAIHEILGNIFLSLT